MAHENLEQKHRKFVGPRTQGTPVLENWTLFADHLNGNVYGHPRFEDGHPVITSMVMEINEEEGWAKTMNTDYKLGKKFGSETKQN